MRITVGYVCVSLAPQDVKILWANERHLLLRCGTEQSKYHDNLLAIFCYLETFKQVSRIYHFPKLCLEKKIQSVEKSPVSSWMISKQA